MNYGFTYFPLAKLPHNTRTAQGVAGSTSRASTALERISTGRSSLERVAPYRAYADAAVRRGGVCVRVWSVVGGQKISQTPFSYRECR